MLVLIVQVIVEQLSDKSTATVPGFDAFDHCQTQYLLQTAGPTTARYHWISPQLSH